MENGQDWEDSAKRSNPDDSFLVTYQVLSRVDASDTLDSADASDKGKEFTLGQETQVVSPGRGGERRGT
jgi:hypothetical protein